MDALSVSLSGTFQIGDDLPCVGSAATHCWGILRDGARRAEL